MNAASVPRAHYVILGKWTEQGVQGLKEAPKRAQAFRKALEEVRGRVVAKVYTMGARDFVSLVEAPGDDALNELVLRTAMQGNVHTVTSKAWTEAESAALVERL